jgi:hypothetical protein
MIVTFYLGDTDDPAMHTMKMTAERHAYHASSNAIVEHMACPHLIVSRAQNFFRISTDDYRVSIDLSETELRAIIAKTVLEL